MNNSFWMLMTLGLFWGCGTQKQESAQMQQECIIVSMSGFERITDTSTIRGNEVHEYVCYPEFQQTFYDYHIRIFNRWGLLMFESKNHTEKWFCSGECPTGVEKGPYVVSVDFKIGPQDRFEDLHPDHYRHLTLHSGKKARSGTQNQQQYQPHSNEFRSFQVQGIGLVKMPSEYIDEAINHGAIDQNQGQPAPHVLQEC